MSFCVTKLARVDWVYLCVHFGYWFRFLQFAAYAAASMSYTGDGAEFEFAARQGYTFVAPAEEVSAGYFDDVTTTVIQTAPRR